MVEKANTIWADGPSSMPFQPKKADLRAWGTWLESIIAAFLGNGGLVYTSRSSLFADLAHPANSSAWVIGDTNVAYNGVYMKSGASGYGSWSRVSDLPFSFIIAADNGAGTPNAIQATSSIPVSSSALVVTNIFESNTGSPVTIQFNGGPVLTMKTNSGQNVLAGGLVAGMLISGYVSGSTFRLVSDQASAAILAAAEDALDQYETIRTLAEKSVQYTLQDGDTNTTIQNVINSVPSGSRILFRVPAVSINLAASPSSNGRIVTWDIDGGANITGPGFLPMLFTPSFYDYDNKKIQLVLSDGGPTANASSRSPVAAFNKYGGPTGVGLNPVAVFSHAKLDNTSNTAIQAAVFEVNDVGGWNGVGANNYVEGVRTQALISANGGSGYGIVSFAGAFGSAYHLLFGSEMGIHNEYADALSYNFFFADNRIASAYNATASGTKKPDAYYTTNIFDPPNVQPAAAYLSSGSVGVSGFAYAQTCTTQIGYDARYATLTYSLIAGPNNVPIRMQNAAKTADHELIKLDGSNVIRIGTDGLSVGVRLGATAQIDGDIRPAGNYNPLSDNAVDLGSGGNRIRNLYIANNPIVGSDQRLKTAPSDLSAAEIAAAKRIRVRTFKYLESVAQKGDDARTHFGVIAQEVVAAFEAEGLDAFAYGVVGKDRTTKQIKKIRTVQRHMMRTVTEKRPMYERTEAGIVERSLLIEIEEAVTETLPLFNEDGSPMMGPHKMQDENGNIIMEERQIESEDGAVRTVHIPCTEMRQMMKIVPVMENVEEEYYEDVDDGEVLSVRYEQLAMLMIAASENLTISHPLA